MKFRSARRALTAVNVALGVAALLVFLAVIIDVFSIGPRKNNPGQAVQTLLPTIPRTVPVAPEIAPDVARAPSSPIRVCATTKLMPFGDSLTTGFEGYRGPLFDALQIRQVPVDFVGSVKTPVANAGVGGDPDHESHPAFLIGPNAQRDTAGKPLNLSDNVAEWFRKAKPDVALILIGAEELREPSTQAGAPAALEGLVTKIKDSSQGTLLILSELPPSVAHPVNDPLLVALNAKAKQLADADLKDLLYFAPVNKKLKDLRFDPKKDLYPDGVRFTLSGGRKYAIAIEPVVAGGVIRDRNRRCAAVKPSPTTAPPSTTPPSTVPGDFFGDQDVVSIDERDFIEG